MDVHFTFIVVRIHSHSSLLWWQSQAFQSVVFLCGFVFAEKPSIFSLRTTKHTSHSKLHFPRLVFLRRGGCVDMFSSGLVPGQRKGVQSEQLHSTVGERLRRSSRSCSGWFHTVCLSPFIPLLTVTSNLLTPNIWPLPPHRTSCNSPWEKPMDSTWPRSLPRRTCSYMRGETHTHTMKTRGFHASCETESGVWWLTVCRKDRSSHCCHTEYCISTPVSFWLTDTKLPKRLIMTETRFVMKVVPCETNGTDDQPVWFWSFSLDGW